MPQRDYAAMLDPESLRTTLSMVSVFVLAFEMFRDRVIEHPQFLHSSGFNEKGWILDAEAYHQDVLSRHKSPLQASLLWFKAQGALNEEDLRTIDRLRLFRNRMVHELGSLVGTAAILDIGPAFPDLVAVFRKVEIWWIRNIEMELDPEKAGLELKDDEIYPGSLLHLQMLVETAFGEGEEAWKWYRAFVAQDRPIQGDGEAPVS